MPLQRPYFLPTSSPTTHLYTRYKYEDVEPTNCFVLIRAIERGTDAFYVKRTDQLLNQFRFTTACWTKNRDKLDEPNILCARTCACTTHWCTTLWQPRKIRVSYDL